MRDQDKSKKQLLLEIAELRQRVEALEAGGRSEVELTDITEQRQAEVALRESEERYRLLVEAIPQPVWHFSAEGKLVDCSRRWSEYTGQAADEAKGDGWMKMVHPDDLDHVLERIQEAGARGDFYLAEHRLRRASDGSYRWQVARALPLKDKDGKTTSWFGSASDVDDLKRAEEALRLSEAKYRRLHQSMMDAFVSVDMDGWIQEYNETYRTMLGYESEELLALRYTDITPKKWHPFEAEIVQKQILPWGYSDTYEKEYRRKDGTIFPVELRTFLITDEKGQPSAMWAIVRDITHRKRAEEALQKAHDELEQRVQERTAELANANEELAMFRRFAEASSQGFSMATLDGHLLYLNPALRHMLGDERPGDRIGQHLSCCYSDESNRRGKEEIEPALKRDGFWEGELPMLTRQKNSIPTWHNAFLIRDERGNPLRIAVVITDISSRKRAEEALRRSEAQIRSLAELLPVGVFAVCDGKIVWANQEAARLYGATRPYELLGMDMLEVLPDDRRPVLSDNLEQILSKSEAVQFHEGAVRRRDGARREVEAGGTPFRFEGRPGALLVVRDITERKRAEEALRASEERFRSYFEQGLVGMAVSSPDRQFLEVNDRLCEILGCSREELLGKTWMDATHPDDVEPNLSLSRRLVAGEIDHYTMDKRYIRKDGGLVHARLFLRGFRRKDGTLDHALAFIEDLTERRQAEDALKASETRYRAVVEDQTEVISRFNADGTFTFVNEVFCRFFGKTSEHLLGNKWHPVVVPDDLPMIEAQLRALSPTSPIVTIENRVYSGTGEVHWMQFVNRGFFDPEGRLVEIQAVGRDITERKQAEEAVQREQRTLKHMLQSSDHERQLIAYEIHDGLAQQLAGAIMQFDTFSHLKDKRPPDAGKAYDAGMTMLKQSHFEARRLISGVRPPILDESGVTVAITHLVHEESRRKGPTIESYCKVDFDRLVPLLENAIYRIVQEALTNACNHSKSKRVRITLLQRNRTVRIEVRDWGVGFDPKAVPKGHFGLADIRERARLLGGKCRIRSKAGEGTSIVAALPVVEREEEE